VSVPSVDLAGHAVSLQLVRAANAGQGGTTYGETSVFVQADSTHNVELFVAGGSLSAWVNQGSGSVNLTPSWPRYDATAMRWLRIRESGGTLYMEYAAGSTAPGAWTVLASTPDPFPLGAVKLRIVAGANVAVTDVASFDNVATS
jgi:hypothetical protein